MPFSTKRIFSIAFVVLLLALVFFIFVSFANAQTGGGTPISTSQTGAVSPSQASSTQTTPQTGGTSAGQEQVNSSSTTTAQEARLRVKNSKIYRVRKNKKRLYMARVLKNAPLKVKLMLQAGNSLVGKRYIYGGGHSSFFENQLDCSGAVSSILGQAGLLQSPLNSSALAQFGEPGEGKWMTIYSNDEHTYIVVAGVRFDTSRQDHPGGSKLLQWRPLRKSNKGFIATHISGL